MHDQLQKCRRRLAPRYQTRTECESDYIFCSLLFCCSISVSFRRYFPPFQKSTRQTISVIAIPTTAADDDDCRCHSPLQVQAPRINLLNYKSINTSYNNRNQYKYLSEWIQTGGRLDDSGAVCVRALRSDLCKAAANVHFMHISRSLLCTCWILLAVVWGL